MDASRAVPAPSPLVTDVPSPRWPRPLRLIGAAGRSIRRRLPIKGKVNHLPGGVQSCVSHACEWPRFDSCITAMHV